MTAPENATSLKSLAVLIDADNASPKIVSGLLAEVAIYGTASVKRIYGDWTSDRLGKWKEELLNHSIQPVQQFAYTTGKNATDSAMIIDAMDLLYTGRFHGFCLVTSDSDFTRLAARIREHGLIVYGFGEKKTPRPFVAACDKFVYTELLTPAEDKPAGATTKIPMATLRQDTQLVNLIDNAIKASTRDESEWANLANVGEFVGKQSPEFDARNYGYSKLSSLIEAIGLFEIDRTEKHLRIRRNPKTNA
ncbi:MAG: NYN domain-containing protein [Verrucomicrobia bacterium]|nr:NYN domain-containing protein [Verrucomicrobiota bacterium]